MSLKEECDCVEGIGSGQISLRGGLPYTYERHPG